jgi:toxin HigB-1
MIVPKKVKHKGLRKFWTQGDTSKLRPEWVGRIKRVLAMLNVAVSPDELRIPGNGWHQLEGDRKGTYSIRVSRNWRLTFRWDEDGPYDVDLEDYHAK